MTERSSLRFQLAARLGALELDVELDTGPGSTLVLVGPNGAGKTSLLSLLLGALRGAALPTRGRIEVGDAVLLDTKRGVDVPIEQRRLGYVPQDYALFPHLDVRGNVAFAVRSASASGGRTRERERERERVDAALRELELTALAERRTQSLSGGEKQRVALARALSVQPRALLLDEPLAALDAHARREVRGFLADTLERLGLPTIVVTHDPTDARTLGARIAVLEAGRITQLGRWEELAAKPASRFVEQLVATARG